MRRATFESAMVDIYAKYRKRAVRLGIEFNITWEDFLLMTKKNCHYCGRSPKNRLPRKEDFFYNGLDRQDNKKAYDLENCVTCCAVCNRAKNAMTYEEWCEYMAGAVSYMMDLKIKQIMAEELGVDPSV